MNIYLLRHGETEENKKKTYYGSLEAGLTERGKLQAEKAGLYLKDTSFGKIFISERKRTLTTAEIVLKGQNPQLLTDSRINEKAFGIFEGLTYEEISSLYPEQKKAWEHDWMAYCPPGGESSVMVYERVKDFMEYIKTLEEDNILIITHGGVIRTIYTYILGGDLQHYWKFASRNGDISVVKYEYGNFYIDRIVPVDTFDN